MVPSKVMKRLFEITHLDGRFAIVASLADAVRDNTTAVSVRGATRGYESLFFRTQSRSDAKRSTEHGAVEPRRVDDTRTALRRPGLLDRVGQSSHPSCLSASTWLAASTA
jgi:hypothetical protein